MKEHAIYKYIKDGEIVYIGKTDNSLENRIECHKKEKKFKKLGKMEIKYFMVKNSTETDIYEKILINKYQPILNVVSKHDEHMDIPIEEPEWMPYDEKKIVKSVKPKKKKSKKKKKRASEISISENYDSSNTINPFSDFGSVMLYMNICYYVDKGFSPTDYETEAEEEGTLDQYVIKWKTPTFTLAGLPDSLKKEMWIIDQFVRVSDIRYPKDYKDGVHHICGYRKLPKIFGEEEEQYEICSKPLTLYVDEFENTISARFSTKRSGRGIYFYIDFETYPNEWYYVTTQGFQPNITRIIKVFGIDLLVKKMKPDYETEKYEPRREFEFNIMDLRLTFLNYSNDDQNIEGEITKNQIDESTNANTLNASPGSL